jgi:hypothetical protein
MNLILNRYWTISCLSCVALALSTLTCQAETVIVDAHGNRTCYPRCPTVGQQTMQPLINVRHGLVAYWDGLFGDTERFVDFDTHVTSIVRFGFDRVDGQFHKKIVHRRDIFIADDDLQKIRAIAASIWAARYPIPTAQVGLDGGWSVRLIDGAATRSDGGMGTPGGEAKELAQLLWGIETRQSLSMASIGRSWFFQYSCYPNPAPVHVDMPQPYFYSRIRWSDPGHRPDEFPPGRRQTTQFQYQGEREICGEWY